MSEAFKYVLGLLDDLPVSKAAGDYLNFLVEAKADQMAKDRLEDIAAGRLPLAEMCPEELRRDMRKRQRIHAAEIIDKKLRRLISARQLPAYGVKEVRRAASRVSKLPASSQRRALSADMVLSGQVFVGFPSVADSDIKPLLEFTAKALGRKIPVSTNALYVPLESHEIVQTEQRLSVSNGRPRDVLADQTMDYLAEQFARISGFKVSASLTSRFWAFLEKLDDQYKTTLCERDRILSAVDRLNTTKALTEICLVSPASE